MTKIAKVGWFFMLLLGIYRFIASIMLYTTGETDISSAVLFFTNAIAIIGITIYAYKHLVKWSWWFLLIIGAAPLINCTILHGFEIWTIIGLILFVPGILLPIGGVFGKK